MSKPILKMAAAALLSGAIAAPTVATADARAQAAAANSLGILEYCQSAGHIGADAVEKQRALYARLPRPNDSRQIDAALSKGKAGILSAIGIEQPIAEAARLQNQDVAGYCQQAAAMSRR